MNLEARLAELGIELPGSAAPGACYAAVVVDGGTAWVSGQLPREGEGVTCVGKLGRDVSLEAAQAAARVAMLRALAALRDELGGLARVRQVLKLNVFVASAEGFCAQSQVSDGASRLLFDLFGPQRGRHARTSVGVAELPRNACLELDLTVALDRQD
jgi:enamine deaminase RidA (YjgF/YER057c/UK114 family)